MAKKKTTKKKPAKAAKKRATRPGKTNAPIETNTIEAENTNLNSPMEKNKEQKELSEIVSDNSEVLAEAMSKGYTFKTKSPYNVIIQGAKDHLESMKMEKKKKS